MGKNKSLIGPFTVQVEDNRLHSWKNETFDSAEEAADLGKRIVQKWQSEGLTRLRLGANLFTNESMAVSKSLRIFDGKDKLCTNKILAL
jgi:hypothetical protein